VFAVWTYAISNVGRTGHVELNPRLLSTLIGESEATIRDAISYLCNPDPQSRSKEKEGRRLLKTGEFEYFMVNYKQYDSLRSEDERREYKREWDREHRPSGHKRAKMKQSDSSPTAVRQATTKTDSPTPLSLTSSLASSLKRSTCAQRFEEFWSEYPKKKSKQEAKRRWERIKPDSTLFETIMEAVRLWKGSDDWLREDGKYIPYPATWLNAGGWEDELPPRKKDALERWMEKHKDDPD